MAEDISRRIDDLLSGAIDEQVREQRAINDTMIGVRDGVSRLVGDVAALSARVTESREASQGLREELPFLVQREVSGATNSLSVRIDVLETAIGELVASLAGLEDRVGPDVIISGVTDKLENMRASEEDLAGSVTAEAARSAIDDATDVMRSSFEATVSSINVMLEKHHTQLSRRMADSKKEMDELEGRMRSLEKGLEAVVKMPGDTKGRLAELTGSVQDMTDGVLEEIRSSSEASSARLAATVDGVERDAQEMNRRFGEMTDQIAKFQEEVLAYLQVRDLALEERRDQIVNELLGDFLDSMPQREREKNAGLLRSVFQRRRDKRDADRFRTGRPKLQPAARPAPQRQAPPPPVAQSAPAPVTVKPAPRPIPVLEEEEISLAFEDVQEIVPAAPKSKPKSPAAKPEPKPKAKPAPKREPTKARKAAKPAPPVDEPPALEEASTPFTESDAFALRAELLTDASDDASDEGATALSPIEPASFERAGEMQEEANAAEKKEPSEEPKEEMKPQPAKAKSKAKPPAKPKKAKVPAKPRKAATPKETAPAGDAVTTKPAVEKEQPSEAPAAVQQPPEDDDDTLSQALQRVQALVDQHRQPRGGRKRPR